MLKAKRYLLGALALLLCSGIAAGATYFATTVYAVRYVPVGAPSSIPVPPQCVLGVGCTYVNAADNNLYYLNPAGASQNLSNGVVQGLSAAYSGAVSTSQNVIQLTTGGGPIIIKDRSPTITPFAVTDSTGAFEYIQIAGANGINTIGPFTLTYPFGYWFFGNNTNATGGSPATSSPDILLAATSWDGATTRNQGYDIGVLSTQTGASYTAEIHFRPTRNNAFAAHDTLNLGYDGSNHSVTIGAEFGSASAYGVITTYNGAGSLKIGAGAGATEYVSIDGPITGFQFVASGSTQVYLDSASLRAANDASGATLGGVSNRWLAGYFGNDSVGITPTLALSLANKTAATSGAANQKWSPGFVLTGHQWNGAADVAVDLMLLERPITGNTIPGQLTLFGRYNAGSWTEVVSITPNAGITTIDSTGPSAALALMGHTNFYVQLDGTTYFQIISSAAQPFTNLGLTSGSSSNAWSANYSRHYVGAGAAWTTAEGTGAGTSPSGKTITGTDTIGTYAISTGTTPASNATLATVTFAATWGNAPICQWECASSATCGLSTTQQPFVSATSTTTATVTTGTVALAGSTAYKWILACTQAN